MKNISMNSFIIIYTIVLLFIYVKYNTVKQLSTFFIQSFRYTIHLIIMFSNNSKIMQDNAYPIFLKIIHHQLSVTMHDNN